MSLYPGAPRTVDGKDVLDDEALQGSMALAIENAMAEVYEKIRNENLPDVGKEDRRMLFVAIAQGVIRYLADNADAFKVTVQPSNEHTHDASVEIEAE